MKTQTYSTRYLSVMLLLCFVSLLGCSDKTETAANPAPQNLTQWLDAQYEEQLLQSPLGLTYLGRSERKDELDEFSFESFKRKLAWQAASVAEMEALFDRAALSEAEKLSYDLWKYSFEKTAASEQYFFNGLIFDQMNGIHSYVPTFLINFHTVESAEDFEALIARVNLVESRMADAIEVARKSSANGVVAPYFAMDGVIEQSEKIISGQPFDQEADFDNALWADMKRDLAGLVEAGVIDNAAATSLEARAQDALLNSFGPAYRNIITWAKEERQSSPEVATGIGSQPSGEAYYEHLLASQTTTDLTADEIHNIGLKEVSRLRLEMLGIMEEVEFKGDLQAFFEEVRTAEWNYYPDIDEGRQAYIDDATLAIDELKALLPTYFGLLPKADLIVKRVEAFRSMLGLDWSQEAFRVWPIFCQW